jgi:hypothetical protein
LTVTWSRCDGSDTVWIVGKPDPGAGWGLNHFVAIIPGAGGKPVATRINRIQAGGFDAEDAANYDLYHLQPASRTKSIQKD